MTNPLNVYQPAIEALEKELTDLERQANALLTSINLLREKSGLPPRTSGFAPSPVSEGGKPAAIHLHSDAFTGMKLGSAVRKYLEMRKQSGGDAPATTREMFDALKDGGFVSGAKDDAIGMVVLRTMLRKNTTTFAKLQNGKYGLRAWYPNLKPVRESPAAAGLNDGEEEEEVFMVDEEGTATPTKASAATS
jgi:hypothetical protein